MDQAFGLAPSWLSTHQKLKYAAFFISFIVMLTKPLPLSFLFQVEHSDYDTPNVIMTYTALLSLAILRDDFSKLDRSGLVTFLRACQHEDGRFVPLISAESFIPSIIVLTTHISLALRLLRGEEKGIYALYIAPLR